MVLPSQTARPNTFAGSRFTLARRRPRRGGKLLGVALLGVLAALLWWMWPKSSGGGPGDGAELQPAGTSPLSPRMTLADGGNKPSLDPIPDRTGRASLDSASATEKTPEAKPAIPASDQAPVNDPATSGTAKPIPPAPVESTPSSAPQPAIEQTSAVQALIDSAAETLARNRPVDARDMLNRALHDPRASEGERRQARVQLGKIADTITFSPLVVPGDAVCATYEIQSGDRLVSIVNEQGLKVDWRLLQRVNQMSDPGRLRVGQKIKIVRGPFHAVVDKSAFRLDLYANVADSDGNRLFIKSFDVGLGEYGSTPEGSWRVRPASKLMDPRWVNPRTGEQFEANDPKNPIGERWIGLEGTDPQTQTLSGYGLHGTIEPESIGKEMSMGCIRLLAPDIELMYEVLVEGDSTVRIVP